LPGSVCVLGLLSCVNARGEGRCKVARRWTPGRSGILLGAAHELAPIRICDVGRPVFAGIVVSRGAWPAAVGASSDASTLPPSATSWLTDSATLGFFLLPMNGFTVSSQGLGSSPPRTTSEVDGESGSSVRAVPLRVCALGDKAHGGAWTVHVVRSSRVVPPGFPRSSYSPYRSAARKCSGSLRFCSSR
jgi:hypothetical protein